LSDPATRAAIRVLGSILAILSGILLFSDKIVQIQFTNTYGFADSQTFLWVLSQSLSPLVLIAASLFKPYRISYSVPVYFYFIQIYWIFDSSLKWDDSLLHIYAFGSALLFCITILIISHIFKVALKERESKISFLEEMLDLKSNIFKKESGL
jgi:hypothetical protein